MSGEKPPRRELEHLATAARLELRDAGDGRPAVLSGIASTFEHPYPVGPFDEVIAATAFPANFASARNVRLLVHHADRDLLATTKAGTLRLRADATGLSFEADVPATQLGRDTAAMVARGDLAGASICFACRRHALSKTGARPLRRVEEADLFEVSLVAVPANDLTSVELRAELDAFLAADLASRDAHRALVGLELAPFRAQLARLAR